MESKVYLHQIATCVPEQSYTQESILDILLKIQGDNREKRAFLKKIYKNTGIQKRHTIISDYHEFFPENASLEPEPTTEQRNDLYIKEAIRLSIKATKELLEKLPNFEKTKITHMITVSCTGFCAPGIDFYITKELGLSSSIHRFHIGFMGCYAAFPALKLARNICLSEPDARVLVVNVELCSVHIQKKFEPDAVVAFAIFSDGISAALISGCKEDFKGDKIILHGFQSSIIDKSEEDMAWKIGMKGFDMKLSVYVPSLIRENIKGILSSLFTRYNLAKEDINLWAVHPGGRIILEKLEKELRLGKKDFKYSYDVLRDYGNMSSTTIMFILEKMLKDSVKGNIFSAAFGPGLTIESGYLEKIND